MKILMPVWNMTNKMEDNQLWVVVEGIMTGR